MAITNFGDSNTRKFAEGKKSKFSGMNQDVAHQRISQIEAITSLNDLERLKSISLHKLNPPYEDYWSINIDQKWRLVFKFKNQQCINVKILDTHKLKCT